MAINNPDSNIGGILKAAFAPASDFASLVHKKNQLQSLSFKPGKNWTEVEFIEDKSGFKINKKNSFAGDYRSIEINIVFPGITLSTDEKLDEWQNQPMIVYIMDGNEKHRIFGTLETPLEMEELGESGDSPTNLNGYTVKIYGDLLKTGLQATFDPLSA